MLTLADLDAQSCCTSACARTSPMPPCDRLGLLGKPAGVTGTFQIFSKMVRGWLRNAGWGALRAGERGFLGVSEDFRFGSFDGTSLHPHPAKHNHFSTRKRRRLRRDRSSPLLCPSWGLIRRYEGNFADTPPSFRPQYTDFAFAKCGVTRPAQAAPRSSAACRQTAAGSDVPPRTRASNSARV